MKATVEQRLARLEEQIKPQVPSPTPQSILAKLAELCERASQGDEEAARRLELFKQLFNKFRQRLAKEN